VILAIVGSRVLRPAQADTAHITIRAYINLLLASFPDLKVISGGAEGVDAIAKVEAYKAGLEDRFEEYLPTVRSWDAPGGYRARNDRIARDCDAILCLQTLQAETYGSGWTFERAIEYGKTEGVSAWRMRL
jgi:hypothetical protein